MNKGKPASSVDRVRVVMHALMFLLGIVLAYDYFKEPSVFGYLLASIIFLGYSSFRLIKYRRARDTG